MSNSVLITQVLLPNLISTLIMVIVSSLIATIIGFALAVVLIITNKKGLAPGTDAVYSFHRRNNHRYFGGDRALDLCDDALCGTAV